MVAEGPNPVSEPHAERRNADGDWYAQVDNIRGHLVTDCKSLYESVHKSDSQTSDKRVMLDIEDMRAGVQSSDTFAWRPTDLMPMDALTKPRAKTRKKTAWLAL